MRILLQTQLLRQRIMACTHSLEFKIKKFNCRTYKLHSEVQRIKKVIFWSELFVGELPWIFRENWESVFRIYFSIYM